MISEHEFADLKAKVARLERGLEQRPYRVPSASNLYILQILDGQTVYNSGGTTFYGISKTLSTITSVGVQYNPDVDQTPGTFTATNGVGRGILYINGVQQTTPVLVLLDSTSPVPVDLVSGDYVQCKDATTIAGPSATLSVYVPIFF